MSGNIGGGTADASIPLQASRGTTGRERCRWLGGSRTFRTRSIPGFGAQANCSSSSRAGQRRHLAQHINQAAYGAMAPLLSLPPGSITHDVLTSNLASTEHNLGIPTSKFYPIYGDGAERRWPEFDARVRALIASRAQIAPESAVGMVTPHAGPTIDTGPTINQLPWRPLNRPPRKSPAGGSYGKGLTPGEATTPVKSASHPRAHRSWRRSAGPPSPTGGG